MSATNRIITGSSIALDWATTNGGSVVVQQVLLCGLSGTIMIPVMVDSSGAIFTTT